MANTSKSSRERRDSELALAQKAEAAEAKHEQDVEDRLARLRLDDEARRRLRVEQAGIRVALPRETSTLDDLFSKPSPERKWAIHDWLPVDGNGVLIAGYKAGKTTLAMNLARALADGEPFLGQYKIDFPSGCVGFLDYEMSETMFRDWSMDMGIQHPERIIYLNMRGQLLPFWDTYERERLADWLITRNVKFLILDPAARAWSGLVDNENDNAQVGNFTTAVDALKRDAGINESVVTHHTGRYLVAEGEERGRGATRLEDWMDAGWYLTKDKDSEQRALRAIGRDVQLGSGQ
jgi:RecA-family ATPase